MGYESITDPDKIESQPNFYIKIIPDKTNSTITIEDSGIGMTKNELINNLGTIANSGLVSTLRTWFRTKFAWLVRTMMMSSTFGNPVLADPSQCRKTRRWYMEK